MTAYRRRPLSRQAVPAYGRREALAVALAAAIGGATLLGRMALGFVAN